jgi:hypothetical protein
MGMTFDNMQGRRGLLLSLTASVLIAVPAYSRAQSSTPLLPVIETASLLPRDESQSPRCRSLECVRRHFDASTTVRLAGEFGRFTGRVTRWDADSLAGFEVDPDWGGNAPVAPIGWSQISNVDKRVSNSGRGAVIGAIALGGLAALFAAAVVAASKAPLFPLASPDANHEINQAALKGALIGGVLGAGIGAGIGASSNRWVLIYRR